MLDVSDLSAQTDHPSGPWKAGLVLAGLRDLAKFLAVASALEYSASEVRTPTGVRVTSGEPMKL